MCSPDAYAELAGKLDAQDDGVVRRGRKLSDSGAKARFFHEVFDGNSAEAPTLEPTLKKVLARYPHIRRLVVVADRGLLSLDNIEALAKLHVAGDRPLEFILAVPGRRYGEFAEILQTMQAKMAGASCEVIDETCWGEHRLVIAHDPITAQEQSAQRQSKIDALHARAAEL